MKKCLLLFTIMMVSLFVSARDFAPWDKVFSKRIWLPTVIQYYAHWDENGPNGYPSLELTAVLDDNPEMKWYSVYINIRCYQQVRVWNPCGSPFCPGTWEYRWIWKTWQTEINPYSRAGTVQWMVTGGETFELESDGVNIRQDQMSFNRIEEQ